MPSPNALLAAAISGLILGAGCGGSTPPAEVPATETPKAAVPSAAEPPVGENSAAPAEASATPAETEEKHACKAQGSCEH